MFVVFNGSDNPWIVLLLIFVQVLVPLMQTTATSEDSEDFALGLSFVLLMVCLLIVFFFKFYGVLRALYQMRGQHSNLTWREYWSEAIGRDRRRREAAASAAARRAAQPSAEESFSRVSQIIQSMPTEEFLTPDELRATSSREVMERLRRRDVDFAGCVEREELVEMLTTFRGGPSNNDTCCICCEEYESGDVLRLLRRCKHEFHLECLDKWAFTSANAARKPACPLCNQALD